MADQIDYLYSGISNETMLSGAETMHDLYLDDVADFTAFDAALDAAFASAWMVDIDAARDFPTDESVVDEISELTDTLNEKWDACKTHFQGAKYFIEQAFPGNQTIHKTFGYDDYFEMSRNQTKVLPFMDQFHDKAEKHKVALIAAGYTQAKIDAIETLSTAYRDALRSQDKAQKDRLKTTQDRMVLHNKVWTSVQRVNKASKTVYRTDFAKLQQYLLPGAGTNEPPEELAVKGTFRNSVTGEVIPGGTFTLTAHNLSDSTNIDGKYGITQGIPAGSTPYSAAAAGFVTANGNVTIIADTTVTFDVALVPV